MEYDNLENTSFERSFSFKKTKNFILSSLIHIVILFSFSAFGKQAANYGMDQALPKSFVNVELISKGPEVPPQVAAIEEPVEELVEDKIELPRDTEFKIPKKETEKKTTKVKKTITVKKAENVASNEHAVSETTTGNTIENLERGSQNSVGSHVKVTDLHAAYLRNPAPQYPQGSRISREEGLVLLLVSIDSAGEVSDVELKTSSGFSRLDRAALQAVNQWTFKPSTLAGIPISDKVEVPIRFELKSN